MSSVKITDIKKGDVFFENDMHMSMEMKALVEDAKLIPIGNGCEGEKYAVKVMTTDGETEISMNKDYVDTHYHLNLTTTPEYSDVFYLPKGKHNAD